MGWTSRFTNSTSAYSQKSIIVSGDRVTLKLSTTNTFEATNVQVLTTPNAAYHVIVRSLGFDVWHPITIGSYTDMALSYGCIISLISLIATVDWMEYSADIWANLPLVQHRIEGVELMLNIASSRQMPKIAGWLVDRCRTCAVEIASAWIRGRWQQMYQIGNMCVPHTQCGGCSR